MWQIKNLTGAITTVNNLPTDLTPEDTDRRLVDENYTMADACMGALEGMLTQQATDQRITVMHRGSLFFFDVRCVGIRPPYEIQPPRPGTGDVCWFGQRGN
jgi:hypothetical protein